MFFDNIYFKTKIIFVSDTCFLWEAIKDIVSPTSDYSGRERGGKIRAGPSGVSQVLVILSIFSRVVGSWVIILLLFLRLVCMLCILLSINFL